MLRLGIQTKNLMEDKNPLEGFRMIKNVGFSCVDFSLNDYLKNTMIYDGKRNTFFDQSIQELECSFKLHKEAALKNEISIHQMHMPYPLYVQNGERDLNAYLWREVVPKSLQICKYLDCKYMVVHGLKLAKFLGSEEAEWKMTEKLLNQMLPLAKELGIVICLEDLYDSIGGHLIEGPCCDIKKVIRRVDQMNEKYQKEVLGFCFDTGHANLVGIDFEDFITKLDYRLKVLHIHDNDGIGDLHQIPYTFTKSRENKPSTDWEGFIKGMQNIHFDKVLSFETAPVLTTFPKEMKKDALEFIHKIGTYFQEQIEGK